VLLGAGAVQQRLVGVMRVPKMTAHCVLVMTVRSTKFRVGLTALEPVKCSKKLVYESILKN